MKNLILLIAIFSLILPGITKAAPADVSPAYFAFKDANYLQTSTAAPGISGSTPYQVASFLLASSSGSILSGTVTAPAGSSPANFAINSTGNNHGDFFGGQSFSTISDMNSAFLNGTYNFTITGSHGTYTPALLVSGTYATGVAMITNTNWVASDLQTSSTSALTLQWSLPGALASNEYLLTINSQNNQTVQTEIALSGSTTSYTLPLLAVGTYNAEIHYMNVSGSDTSDIATATGYGGYVNTTAFTINSVPEPSTWIMLMGGLGVLVVFQRRR